jgi:hypothetical protein
MAALTTPKPDYSTIFDSYTNNDLSLSQCNQSPLFNLILLPSPSPIVPCAYRIKEEDLYPIESSQDRIKEEDPYPNEFPCLAGMARSVIQEDSEQTCMPALDESTVAGKKIVQLEESNVTQLATQDKVTHEDNKELDYQENSSSDENIAQQEEKNVPLYAEQVKVKHDPEEDDGVFVKAKDVLDIDILSHRGIASTKHPGKLLSSLFKIYAFLYEKKFVLILFRKFMHS